MNDSQFLSILGRSEISPFLTINICGANLGLLIFGDIPVIAPRSELYCDAGQLSSQPHSLIGTRYVNISLLMKFSLDGPVFYLNYRISKSYVMDVY